MLWNNAGAEFKPQSWSIEGSAGRHGEQKLVDLGENRQEEGKRGGVRGPVLWREAGELQCGGRTWSSGAEPGGSTWASQHVGGEGGGEGGFIIATVGGGRW